MEGHEKISSEKGHINLCSCDHNLQYDRKSELYTKDKIKFVNLSHYLTKARQVLSIKILM